VFQEHSNARQEADGVPFLGDCLRKANESDMKLFVDLMVAMDYKDSHKQTNISWVHLAKLFAFILKENRDFMKATLMDLEEDLVHTIASTNVWKYFAEENRLYFQCVEKILSRGFQDNPFIICHDQSTIRISPTSKRSGNSSDNSTTISKINGNSLMTTRRVVNYVCRAPINNKGIHYLQTIVILKAIFEIWPNLEIRLQNLFQTSDFLEGNKKRKKKPVGDVAMREMETTAKRTRSDKIYAALRRTWHGNLVKYPSLRDIEQILSCWRNEEKMKQKGIESFSVEHAYHMERLHEDISAWHIYENDVWVNLWNRSDWLSDMNRQSIAQIGNSEPGTRITSKTIVYDKETRIETLTKDKSLNVSRLKEMCAAANATYNGRASRKVLIKALSDKEYPNCTSTGIKTNIYSSSEKSL